MEITIQVCEVYSIIFQLVLHCIQPAKSSKPELDILSREFKILIKYWYVATAALLCYLAIHCLFFERGKERSTRNSRKTYTGLNHQKTLISTFTATHQFPLKQKKKNPVFLISNIKRLNEITSKTFLISKKIIQLEDSNYHNRFY